MAHYHTELNALRLSLRARNLHRLDSIADISKNDMAKVGAIKVLEQIADVAEQHNRPGSTHSPGVVIVIQQPAARPIDIGPEIITIDPTPAAILRP
jgi:hypothetical protein